MVKVKKHSFAHFCHDLNIRYFYLHNHECQFDVKRDIMQVAPKISY